MNQKRKEKSHTKRDGGPDTNGYQREDKDASGGGGGGDEGGGGSGERSSNGPSEAAPNREELATR